jgi:large subunit ribosomal protein L22
VPDATARLRYLRVSPFKVRPVLDLVRGKDVTEAREILRFSDRGPARQVAKVLDSAVANAEHNEHIPADELFVAAAYADEGPTLKRFRPRARGRATRIRKRTAHVTIVVARYPEEELRRRAAREAVTGGAGERRRRALRRRRVEASVAAAGTATEEATGTGTDEAVRATDDAPAGATGPEAAEAAEGGGEAAEGAAAAGGDEGAAGTPEAAGPGDGTGADAGAGPGPDGPRS